MAGVGHLNIGVGEGGATVWNSQPAIDQFTNILQQQKARRDADNKQINDIVASYDPTGLRNDADRQDAFKQYSDWKQQAINAENEKNPQKRAMAIAQVREGFNRLQSFVGQSKKQGHLEQLIGIDLMKNRHNYTDDSIDRYKKSVQSGINSGDIITSPLDIERKVDPEKMDADYKKYKDSLIKPTQWDNGTISTTDYFGKKIGTRIQNRGIAMDGDNGAFHNMLNYVSAHDDFKKGLQDRYPNIQGSDEATTNALRTRQYMNDMGDSKGFYDTPKETHLEGAAPDKFYEHELWKQKHGIGENGGLTPIQSHYVQPMIQQGMPALQKFADLANQSAQGNFRAGEKVVPFEQNGYHGFHVPDEVKLDPKIDKANKEAEKDYKENPEKKDRTLGMFGGTKIPWEESEAYKENYQDPYKVVKQGGDITLNPQDQTDYAAKVAELSTRLKVPVDAINKMAGAKSGKGEIPKVGEADGSYKNVTQAKDSKGNIVTLGYKNGKWYDTKTNKPVE